MKIHKCPALHCKVVILTSRLMCMKHWQMVPKDLQDAVWRTWRSKNKPAHLAAAKAAIKFVWQSEKPSITPAESL